MLAFQTSTEARFLSKSAHRLVYYCPLHKYNWAKHSVCTTSLNEKAVAHSTLLGSKNVRKKRFPYFSILRGHCFLPFFDTIKYKPARAFPTFSNLQIHAPCSDQMYSGVQQLPMCTQIILNCSACPKSKIFETKCKQRIYNNNYQAQCGKNARKLMHIKFYKF
jgi:hypothetical protein